MATSNRIYQIIRAAREYRQFVRVAAKAGGSTCPIQVRPGSAAPHTVGESYHYTTPGGKPVHHPNAYRRAWGKPVYHASTYRIEVGEAWLAKYSIPAWSMTVAETAEELVRLGALGAAGLGAVAIGTTPERALDTLPLVGGWLPPAARSSAQDVREAA